MPRLIDRVCSEVVRQMAQAVPAADILAGLCRAFEQEVSGTIAGVTILDRSLQIFDHAIFPSLSPDYAEALRGAVVADKPGSCALAVFNGETVLCPDVASDARFAAGWKALGLQHRLEALASIPARGAPDLVLGTFVVGWPPAAPLDEAQMETAREFADLCGTVLAYRRNQLRQELLVGELQHRVRNLFSTIGAVVYATLKSHPKPDSFRRIFDGRLLALARAHSLALEPGECDLRQLLVDTLAPYSIDHEVTIDGPKLLLSDQAAVAFGLAAHELATNAAKYGAFSGQGGAVHIGWDLAESGGAPAFSLRWRESGGPEVASPQRQGYGQKTLRRSIASAFDGKVELDYRASGLECSINAPYSPRLGVLAN